MQRTCHERIGSESFVDGSKRPVMGSWAPQSIARPPEHLTKWHAEAVVSDVVPDGLGVGCPDRHTAK